MFTRRDALVGFALPWVATGFRSYAAALSSAKRVGYLTLAEDAEDAEFKRVFLEILASRGWSVGNNLSIVHVDAGGRVERLVPLADELVRNRVDLVVTGGHVTTLAAARATASIPVVFSGSVQFPIEQGLIESYARPGRNVVGAAISHGEITGKRLTYLKQLVPSANRLAWLLHDNWTRMDRLSGGSIDVVALLFEAARTAGFETRFFPFNTETDLAKAFNDVDAWRPEAFTASVASLSQARQLAGLAFRRKLPNAFSLREAVEAGGLLSYSAQAFNVRLNAQFAASYVDRILRGANPATLPIEFATRYDLVVNASTAEAFGLSIPQALLVSAEVDR